jgi:glycosyltransferase involved in cell wall biosynthesis
MEISADTAAPEIAILLATFCGERFLHLQLASFERQTARNWRLYASDDGSTDDTLAILRRFQQKLGPEKVDVRIGPGRGYIANFLSLIADERIKADYYALSDQDDLWRPQKLTRAVELLAEIPAHIPALYCSRTEHINEDGRPVGFSPLYRKKPSFANALVQNIAGGNTMVFNVASRQLLLTCPGIRDVPFHDWWLYLAVSAAGGAIFYDNYCSVGYRLHSKNIIGPNSRLIPRFQRLFDGRFMRWMDMNIDALERIVPVMPEHNRRIYSMVREARRQGLLKRLLSMWRSGVYRQTSMGNIGLIVCVMLNKS